MCFENISVTNVPGQGKGAASAGDYEKYMSDFQQYMKGQGK